MREEERRTREGRKGRRMASRKEAKGRRRRGGETR